MRDTPGAVGYCAARVEVATEDVDAPLGAHVPGINQGHRFPCITGTLVPKSVSNNGPPRRH